MAQVRDNGLETKVMTVAMATNRHIWGIFYRKKRCGLLMDIGGETWEALRMPASLWKQ